MKIALYNVENLFHRDISLFRRTFHESIASWTEEFEALISKPLKGVEEIRRMRELSHLMDYHQSAGENYGILRRKEGELYLRRKGIRREIKAGPMNKWNGWIRVKSKPLSSTSTENKARVLSEVNPDILVLNEVEDRPSLVDFNNCFLPKKMRYSQIMLIPGNDGSSREMALLLKSGYEIEAMKSYANLTDDQGLAVFDKDLQEFKIITAEKDKIIVVVVHMEDAGVNRSYSISRRKIQALIVQKLIHTRRSQGYRYVVLAGTLNAPSFCESVAPVIKETGLVDLKRHPGFNVDLDEGKDAEYYSLGAYRTGVNMRQRSYLLLSPELYALMQGGGLHRRGVFPENSRQWRCYENIFSPLDQASSHPVLWANFKFNQM